MLKCILGKQKKSCCYASEDLNALTYMNFSRGVSLCKNLIHFYQKSFCFQENSVKRSELPRGLHKVVVSISLIHGAGIFES